MTVFTEKQKKENQRFAVECLRRISSIVLRNIDYVPKKGTLGLCCVDCDTVRLNLSDAEKLAHVGKLAHGYFVEIEKKVMEDYFSRHSKAKKEYEIKKVDNI